MNIEKLIYEVELPDGVSFSMDNYNVKLSGSRGELNRDFKHPKISISEDNGKITLTGKKIRRKEKALIGTWRAHLNNMAQGVSSGFLYEMKIVFAHFPMKVAVKGNVVAIDNFLGEKVTRNAYICGDVKVIAKGDKVDAQITNIDKKSRKITLSIKAREILEEKKAMKDYGSSDSGATLGDILGVALNADRK